MRPREGKAGFCEGDKKWLREGKQMERLNLRRGGGGGGGVWRESFFCVCLERMGVSYTPHSVNLARAVASSRLHSGALSWAGCPGEGHLQQPQTLVKSLTGGTGGGGVGWGLGWKDALRFQERDMCWNPQVEAERPSQKKNFCPWLFPPWTSREEDTASNPRMKSRDWTGG